MHSFGRASLAVAASLISKRPMLELRMPVTVAARPGPELGQRWILSDKESNKLRTHRSDRVDSRRGIF